MMKVFFLYLLIVTADSYYWIKVPFGFTLRPITCEDAWNKTVKILPNPKYKEGNGENWVVIMYKDKYVAGHYCKDEFGNYWNGYEEQLNYDLGH
jgi:hypothetical protein